MAAAAMFALLPTATAAADPIDPATAQESLAVWIRDNSAPPPVPVEGAQVEVKGPKFDETLTTGADGKVEVGLPGPGTYTVTVAKASVPSGKSVAGENPRKIAVAAGNKAVPANFLYVAGSGGTSGGSTGGGSATPSKSATPGAGDVSSGSNSTADKAATGYGFWGIFTSKIVTGIIYGLLLALAAIGVSLIYGTTGLNNFAHGELVTFGALMAYTSASVLKIPGPLGGVVGIIAATVLGGAFGWLQDLAIWKPLRKRGLGLVPLMIVSIGFALATRYVFNFIWGSDRLTLPNNVRPFLVVGPVSLRFTDVMGAVLALIALLLVGYVMQRTKLGKAARAVADNRSLAAASGIDVESVIRAIWIGGGALAGLAGALIGYYQSLRWDTGSQILLLIFAAVTLGGLGSAYGALVGALVISVFINLSTLFIPDNLKYAAALIVMIIILLFRPQGILGRRERIG
jgi:branched-subunit amino acid ABC-type transport system permease component